MPYDVFSIGVIIASAALLLCAARPGFSLPVRLAFILLAALLVRVDSAWQHSLYPWDERYHALVAKNLIAHPLVPVLYREAPIAYDYRDWMTNHVWLHKPPGALWLMAAAMSVFGVDEIVMRLPSVLLSTLSVGLTFLIGAAIWNARIGLLAAGFHSVNGFLVSLAAGRRVADHVDTALIFWVELGIYAALLHTRKRTPGSLAVAGIALGCALLTKSMPGLLIAAVAVILFTERETLTKSLARAAAILFTGALLWVPWLVYTNSAFPREAVQASRDILLHLDRVVEGHDEGPLSYLIDMPAFFGELVWLPLAGAVWLAMRRRQPGERAIVAWVVITYAVFSIAQTRLSAFVMIAAPALFLLQASFWCWLADLRVSLIGWRRTAAAALLVLLLILPARYLLDPSGVFERRDRLPVSTQQMKTLDAVVTPPNAIIFNMPTAIEAMFYSKFIVYPQMPAFEEVRSLQSRGIPVVIYMTPGTPLVPEDWGVIRLTPDQLR